MDIEELKKLDSEKNQVIYNAEDINRALRVLEEMRNMDYPIDILTNEYHRLIQKRDELHKQIFPPK